MEALILADDDTKGIKYCQTSAASQTPVKADTSDKVNKLKQENPLSYIDALVREISAWKLDHNHLARVLEKEKTDFLSMNTKERDVHLLSLEIRVQQAREFRKRIAF
jgi:hypothetical protein